MRLTADLVERSAAFTNTLGERELDLRSNHIPAIENLIATKDLFDVIDLTGNEIKKLENFPRLLRLSSLLLSSNAISRIDSSFFSPKQLPLLHTLLLTNNRILDFSDLEPLSAFAGQLAHLSLLDNPVAKKAHYRLWVLSRLPRLRSLDFKRVRPSEVAEAQRMFPGSEGAKTFVPGDAQRSGSTETRLTAEQVAKVKAAIKAAKTLAEINRLERILQTGYIPDSNEMAFLRGAE